MFIEFMTDVYPEENRGISDMPRNVLAEYLNKFFMGIRDKSGGSYNASSLRTIYHSLARHMLAEYSIDLKKEAEFSMTKKILARKMEESASEGKIPGANKTKPVPIKDIKKMIQSNHMSMDTPRSLMTLLIVKIQTGFGLRGGIELYNIMLGDIVFVPSKENCEYSF